MARVKRKRRLPPNWRSRIEITREDEPVVNSGRGRFRYLMGSIRFTLRFKKGQTPRGFRTWIGDLLICDEEPYSVDGAEIDDYFVRRGLGTLLYLHALNELGSLTTLYHSASDAAKGLWRRLIRRTRSHKTDFWKGTLTIYSCDLRYD